LLVGFVEQNPHIDTAPLGLRQSLHDRLAGHAIGLHQNPRSGTVDLIDNHPRAILTRGEASADFSRLRESARETKSHHPYELQKTRPHTQQTPTKGLIYNGNQARTHLRHMSLHENKTRTREFHPA
jgi:hypothetical protein